METGLGTGSTGMAKGSYRTYEEWKRSFTQLDKTLRETVLTVPMRNGNKARPFIFERMCRVLTVPMRNGNREQMAEQVHHWTVLTVPMRNGNTIQKAYPKTLVLFLPYL